MEYHRRHFNTKQLPRGHQGFTETIRVSYEGNALAIDLKRQHLGARGDNRCFDSRSCIRFD